MTFSQELESLLNRYSMDTKTNTPDFILAEYLLACLGAYKGAQAASAHWHRTSTGVALGTTCQGLQEGIASGKIIIEPSPSGDKS